MSQLSEQSISSVEERRTDTLEDTDLLYTVYPGYSPASQGTGSAYLVLCYPASHKIWPSLLHTHPLKEEERKCLVIRVLCTILTCTLYMIECTIISKNILGVDKIFWYAQEYPRVYTVLKYMGEKKQKYPEVCKSIQEYANIHKSLLNTSSGC